MGLDNPSLARARAASDLGRFEESSREAGLAIARDPEDPQAYYLLAYALHKLDRHAEALSALNSGRAKAPAWAPLFILASDVLRAQKRYDDALTAANEAVRLDPHASTSHAAVALSHADLGQHHAAQEALARALSLDPDQPAFHRMLGNSHLALGNPQGAESEYRKALAMEPSDAPSINNLGVALLRQDRAEEAALAFRAAMIIDPTLKVAKQNTHRTMKDLLGGFGVLGVLLLIGIKLLKFKFLIWVLLFARRLLVQPETWIVLGAAVAAAVAVMIVRRRKRLARLRQSDPQLLALFQKLEADRKAGRI